MYEFKWMIIGLWFKSILRSGINLEALGTAQWTIGITSKPVC